MNIVTNTLRRNLAIAFAILISGFAFAGEFNLIYDGTFVARPSLDYRITVTNGMSTRYIFGQMHGLGGYLSGTNEWNYTLQTNPDLGISGQQAALTPDLGNGDGVAGIEYHLWVEQGQYNMGEFEAFGEELLLGGTFSSGGSVTYYHDGEILVVTHQFYWDMN